MSDEDFADLKTLMFPRLKEYRLSPDNNSLSVSWNYPLLSKKDVKRVTEMLAAQFPATTPVGAAYDLSIAEERQKLFFVQPTVDILINNMGIFEPMDYFDIDDATWERFFNVNVMAGNDLARFYLKRCSRRTLGASSSSRVRRR